MNENQLCETGLKKLMESAEIPGISLSIVNKGKLSQETSLGKTNILCKNDDVAVETVFEAASLSKVVFA